MGVYSFVGAPFPPSREFEGFSLSLLLGGRGYEHPTGDFSVLKHPNILCGSGEHQSMQAQPVSNGFRFTGASVLRGVWRVPPRVATGSSHPLWLRSHRNLSVPLGHATPSPATGEQFGRQSTSFVSS